MLSERKELLCLGLLLAFVYIQCSVATTNPFDYEAPMGKPLGGRIINGTLAKQENTRHQVSVRRRLNDGYFFGTGHICGGALVAPSVVLSAAHCFIDYSVENGTFLPDDDFIAVMGNLDRFIFDDDVMVFDINRIIYALEHFDQTTFYKDIAILLLSGEVPANHPTVQPILINRITPLEPKTVCQVTGWGQTEEGYLSDNLMTVDVPLIAEDVCKTQSDFAPEAIREGMMCAGYLEQGERDACQGDSGGPLVCAGKHAGIVSWGIKCALPKLPGVYTDVAFYASWVEEQLSVVNITLPGGNGTQPGGNGTKPDGGGAMMTTHSSLYMIIFFATVILSLHKHL